MNSRVDLSVLSPNSAVKDSWITYTSYLTIVTKACIKTNLFLDVLRQKHGAQMNFMNSENSLP